MVNSTILTMQQSVVALRWISSILYTSLFTFYSAHNARIASAVLATAIPSVSVRPSVRPSVCHTPVLCQNDGTVG